MNNEPLENQKEKQIKVDWANPNNNWTLGIALIILGGLFLLDTFDIVPIQLHNWWAVFILVPGLNMAVDGFRAYRNNGRAASRRSGFWGLVLIVVAFTFFFDISWAFIMPALLIGAGLYLLVLK